MAHKTEQIPFAGRMDFDTPPQNFPKGWARSARNIIWNGPDGDMRGENIAGTRLIPNLILPAGVNCCIGGVYDQVNADVYYCNYNSNGNHAIYIFNIKSEQIKTLNVDSAVLDFDPAKPIHSISILYGDEISGNLLFWLSSDGVPTRVNIKQALAGDYGTYRKEYINVIKRPPNIPVGTAYENTDLTINNERKQLFKFKYWFEYETFEDSVTSAHSVMSVPLNPFDTAVDTDPTKNSGMGLIIQTGDPTVKKIHLACAYNTGTTYSDFFEIDLLDKSDLSISDDDIYLYKFYNDRAYLNIGTDFSTLLFDRVPKQAGAQELMNGNTPIYGNYLEGFNPVKVNVAAQLLRHNVRKTLPTAALVVAQKGQSVGIVAGENIHLILTGIVRTGDYYEIRTTNEKVFTTASGTTISSALADISTALTTAGFTIVSTGTNDIVFNKAGERLLASRTIPVNTQLASTDVSNSSDWWSREAYALSYYDADGRTNGAFFTKDFTIETSPYWEDGSDIPQIPYSVLSIYHQPPVWASYFHLLRTNNLTKLKFIQWISDRTFKDNIASDDGNLYAYISIENLYQYIKDHPSSNFLAYDFTPGDRIRFIKLYPKGALSGRVIYSGISSDQPVKDYEIQGAVENPVINGLQQQGQFIKIILPDVGEFFDFGVQPNGLDDASIDYSNYFIELYTPALPATENLNQYFEFGQQYAIIDAGLTTRRHQGMIQDQTANYVTPATYSIENGLHYARYRSINASNKLKYTLVSEDNPEVKPTFCVPMTLTESFNSVGWDAKESPGTKLQSPFEDSDQWFINVTDGREYTFNVRGTIVIEALNSIITHYNWYVLMLKADGTTTTSPNFFDIFPVINGKRYTFIIDTSFTIPAGYIKAFFLAAAFPEANTSAKIISGELTITEAGRTYTQLVIDPNFSDSFQSAVNSNGRALTFDPDAAETRFPVGARYGLNFQKDTNINDSNRFYPQNTDSYNAAYGPVMKYRVHGQQMRVFQYRRTGAIGIYKKWITQADNSKQLITSESIITPNNIDYYDGDFGIGNQVMGVASSGYVDYFADPVRGYLIRLSLDGLTPISDLYKVQTWAGRELPPYTLNIPYQYGGYAKILGALNIPSDRPTEYICFAQKGHSNDGIYGIYDIGGEMIAFEEKRNAFTANYDINPDFALCAENKLIVWNGGQLYMLDDTENYNTFFGEKHDSVVQIISRDPKDIKKDYTTVSFNQPKPQYNVEVPIWEARNIGDVETSLGQQSNIITEDFYFDQDMYHAPIQGEWDTQYGVINGNEMKGLWLSLTLRNNSNKFTFLSSLYINWILSQKNF